MQTDCFPDSIAEWPKGPISELANVNPRYPMRKGCEYPFVEMASVGENFGGIQKFEVRTLEGSGLSRFRAGDTLFAKITPCPQNGKVAFVTTVPGDIGLGSTEFTVLSPRPETHPRFLFHLACSHAVRGHAAARMEGSTGRQRVPDDVFTKRLLVPLPGPEEQHAIAHVLDAVDTALERVRATITEANRVHDALAHTLLERGIGDSGRVRMEPRDASTEYVDTSAGRVPKSWRIESLGAVADVERGRFSPRPRNDPRYYNGPFPFIQTGLVAQSRGRILATATQSLNAAGKAVSREFPAGTIMVTIAANIGETAILGRPMCAPDSLVGVMPRDGHDPRFIELCVRRLRPRLTALAPRSAQANINLTFLKPLRIPVAPPSEQTRISALVDCADSRVQVLETKVSALERLKESLMHDLFTGRVRVRDTVGTAAP